MLAPQACRQVSGSTEWMTVSCGPRGRMADMLILPCHQSGGERKTVLFVDDGQCAAAVFRCWRHRDSVMACVIEIDVLRTVAIVRMIVYHLLFDLEFLYGFPFDLSTVFLACFRVSSASLFCFWWCQLRAFLSAGGYPRRQ